MPYALILLVFALVFFALDAFVVPRDGRFNLTAAGLACVVLYMLAGQAG